MYRDRVLSLRCHSAELQQLLLAIVRSPKSGRRADAVVHLEDEDLTQADKFQLVVAEQRRKISQHAREPCGLVARRLCGNPIADPQGQPTLAPQREQRIVNRGARTPTSRI